MYVCLRVGLSMCKWYLQSSGEGPRLLNLEIQTVVNQWLRGPEPKSGPFQEQYIILTTEHLYLTVSVILNI